MGRRAFRFNASKPQRKNNDEEARLQESVISTLETLRIPHCRMYLGGIMFHALGETEVKRRPNPNKGFPDLFGALRVPYQGLMFGIELKSKDGKLSADQKKWQQWFANAGCPYIVGRSIDDVLAFLRRYGQIP